MHPAFYSWWKHAVRSNGAWAESMDSRAPGFCGPGGGGGGGGGRGGPFGRGGPGPGEHGDHGADHDGHGHGPGRGRGFGPPDEVGAFGVRRPLRFLAHKLDLTEAQVPELARILDELKTERAQAEVDRRRTVASFADALSGETFDTTAGTEGGDLRVKSAEHLRDAVLKALREIHTVLNSAQRVKLAYLIRTATLAI